MRTLHSRFTQVIILAALALLLASCVGYVVGSAEYREVQMSEKHMSEVISRFGEPLRRESSNGLEVWFYKLKGKGIAGKAVERTSSAAYLVLLPVEVPTNYDDNLRITFRGDTVVLVEERQAKFSGAVCGIPSHMFPKESLIK